MIATKWIVVTFFREKLLAKIDLDKRRRRCSKEGIDEASPEA
jgi:hypothetical protein